jgi:hypothetical protein
MQKAIVRRLGNSRVDIQIIGSTTTIPNVVISGSVNIDNLKIGSRVLVDFIDNAPIVLHDYNQFDKTPLDSGGASVSVTSGGVTIVNEYNTVVGGDFSSPLTTKGDLLTHNGVENIRFPVALNTETPLSLLNDNALLRDYGQPNHIKWGNPRLIGQWLGAHIGLIELSGGVIAFEHTDASGVPIVSFSGNKNQVNKTQIRIGYPNKYGIRLPVSPNPLSQFEEPRDLEIDAETLIGTIPADTLPFSGQPTGNKFLRDDLTWQSLAGGGGSGDAADVTYSPSQLNDWNNNLDPGNVDGALNQLADRVDNLESINHHDAVTLDSNADDILSLSAQQIGLVSQAANTIFAGPASGSSAVPTFRSISTNDIGDDLINKAHISWGLSGAQVNASDLPIIDIGNYFTADNVESALQEVVTLKSDEFSEEPEYGSGTIIVPGASFDGSLLPADNSNKNCYKWTSKDTDQTVIIIKRFRLPVNFVSLSTSLYINNKVSLASGNNGITVVFKDGTGATVLNSSLIQNTSWTETLLTLSTGSYSPGDVVTLQITMHADTDESAFLSGYRISYQRKL